MKLKLKAWMGKASTEMIGNEIRKTENKCVSIKNGITNSQETLVDIIMDTIPGRLYKSMAQDIGLKEEFIQYASDEISEYDFRKKVRERFLYIFSEAEKDARYILGHFGFACAIYALTSFNVERAQHIVLKRLNIMNKFGAGLSKEDLQELVDEANKRITPELRKELKYQGRRMIAGYFAGAKLNVLTNFQKKRVAKEKTVEVAKSAIKALKVVKEEKTENSEERMPSAAELAARATAGK